MEPVTVVTVDVLGVSLSAIKRDEKILIPLQNLLKLWNVDNVYHNSTLHRKRKSMDIPEYPATNSELQVLRKQSLIPSATSKCILIEKKDGESFIKDIAKSVVVTTEAERREIKINKTDAEVCSSNREEEDEYVEVVATDDELIIVSSEDENIQSSDSEREKATPSLESSKPRLLLSDENEGATVTSTVFETSSYSKQRRKTGRKRKLQLPANAPPEELDKIGEYYAKEFNFLREGNCLSPISVQKMKVHLTSKFPT